MRLDPGSGYTVSNQGNASSLEIDLGFKQWAIQSIPEEVHPFKIYVKKNTVYSEGHPEELEDFPYRFEILDGHVSNVTIQNPLQIVFVTKDTEYGVYISVQADASGYPTGDNNGVLWFVKSKNNQAPVGKWVPDNTVNTGKLLIGTVIVSGTEENPVFTINQMVKSSQMTERIKFSNENSGVRYYFNRV